MTTQKFNWRERDDYIEKVGQVKKVSPNLCVEVVGSWVWVTGNTKPVKDQIKQLGFFWARKKGAWYWRADDQKTRQGNRKYKPLADIRAKYGSEEIQA